MHLLLIEDNLEIADNIKKLLTLYNPQIKIDTAFDFVSWWKKFKQWYPDITIIDIMLPGWSWFDLVKKIKSISNTPVIIITALGDDESKIRWLSLGADDYIVKPFKVKELLLRIQNILKRYPSKHIFKIDDLTIDIKNQIIQKSWQNIILKPKEFAILSLLIQNQTMSKSDLAYQIRWEDLNPNIQNKLDVYISNLRKKLWKDIIKTIKWYWYQINEKISKI